MGTHLVLDCAEETGLLPRRLAALVENSEDLHASRRLLAEGSSLGVADAAETRLISEGSKRAARWAHLAWMAPVRARANMATMAGVGLVS